MDLLNRRVQTITSRVFDAKLHVKSEKTVDMAVKQVPEAGK